MSFPTIIKEDSISHTDKNALAISKNLNEKLKLLKMISQNNLLPVNQNQHNLSVKRLGFASKKDRSKSHEVSLIGVVDLFKCFHFKQQLPRLHFEIKQTLKKPKL